MIIMYNVLSVKRLEYSRRWRHRPVGLPVAGVDHWCGRGTTKLLGLRAGLGTIVVHLEISH